MFGVPYRYDREFSGKIIDDRGARDDSFTLFVRYQGVEPSSRDDFERFLTDAGHLRSVQVGDGSIAAVDESVAFDACMVKLNENIDYFLEFPHPRGELDPTFLARADMVAL